MFVNVSFSAFSNIFNVCLFAFSVLCFQEHLKVYYNSSTEEQCTSVVSVVSPELTPGDIWLIQSEVVLERDCNYTVHVTSDSGAHKDLDSSGVFSISE